MKILLIDNFFYRKGGAEVVFLNTGKLLEEHGEEVVYFSQKWDKNLSCKDEKYFSQGISADTQGVINKIKGVSKYFYNREAATMIEKLIVAEKPDVAHIHLFWGGISPSVLKALKKYNVPVVHTVHDYRMICPAYAFRDISGNVCEKCKGGKYYKCIANRCSRGNIVMSALMSMEMYFRNAFINPRKYIDGFMFVSNFAKNKHFEHEPGFRDCRCVTMYNFQDASVLANVDDTIDTYDSYYLFYGRLSEEKGIKTLIQAMKQFPNLKLKIVGTGPLEDELKKLCVENKLGDVEFLGFKSGDELFDLVRRAKFTCVPSEWYENNPMTIIEAYTLRTPVIGAAIAGITEIVDDGNTGYLFESGNVNSLVEAIKKSAEISKDDYIKMKDNADEFADENFDKEKYYNKLIDLYKATIDSCKK